MYPLVYSNNDIVYLKNRKIEEYDIIEGGYSVAISENLFEPSFEEYLKELNDKHKRHVAIGKYIINNKEFNDLLYEGFRKYIKAFIYFNNVQDPNILHIKKDSITCIDSNISRLKFKNVIFRKTSSYTSYLNINKKEFYYNANDSSFSYKKLKENIPIKNNLLEVICHLMLLDSLGKNQLAIFKFLKELRSSYLNRELTSEYYRELNSQYQFKMKSNSGNIYYIDYIDDDYIEDLDITYNYDNYIKPLIEIFI